MLKNIKLEEQLLLKSLLVLVFFVKVYLVKMCLIFDGSSLAFGASYQSFLRVYWFLPLGVTNFAYPSEKFNNPTDVNHQVEKSKSKKTLIAMVWDWGD